MSADRLKHAISLYQSAEQVATELRADFHRAVQAYLTEQTLTPGSAKRLARKLNTSIQVISNYKHGHGTMSIEWARAAMKALGDL